MVHIVRVQPSGHEFDVDEEEFVLDAALRQGLAFPYGCRNGACGSCRARVLRGGVDYPIGVPAGISENERRAGFALLCRVHARDDLELEIEEIDSERAIQVRTLPVRVVGKHALAHDVMRLRLQLPAGERLQFLAGQYVDIMLRDGRRRAFSIANAPSDDETLELHVRLVPNGKFSSYVFEDLKERALLRLHGPLGNFYLRRNSEAPVLLVAGGTGLAPIKSILEDLMQLPLQRDFRLYWGVRTRRDLYLDDAIRGWCARDPRLRYTPVLSEPAPEDRWSARTGFVHEAVLEDLESLAGYDIYASGPPAMVDAIRDRFPARGAALERLYSDSFDYAYETGHDG